jgi:hypothetical protein
MDNVYRILIDETGETFSDTTAEQQEPDYYRNLTEVQFELVNKEYMFGKSITKQRKFMHYRDQRNIQFELAQKEYDEDVDRLAAKAVCDAKIEEAIRVREHAIEHGVNMDVAYKQYAVKALRALKEYEFGPAMQAARARCNTRSDLALKKFNDKPVVQAALARRDALINQIEADLVEAENEYRSKCESITTQYNYTVAMQEDDRNFNFTEVARNRDNALQDANGDPEAIQNINDLYDEQIALINEEFYNNPVVQLAQDDFENKREQAEEKLSFIRRKAHVLTEQINQAFEISQRVTQEEVEVSKKTRKIIIKREEKLKHISDKLVKLINKRQQLLSKTQLVLDSSNDQKLFGHKMIKVNENKHGYTFKGRKKFDVGFLDLVDRTNNGEISESKKNDMISILIKKNSRIEEYLEKIREERRKLMALVEEAKKQLKRLEEIEKIRELTEEEREKVVDINEFISGTKEVIRRLKERRIESKKHIEENNAIKFFLANHSHQIPEQILPKACKVISNYSRIRREEIQSRVYEQRVEEARRDYTQVKTQSKKVQKRIAYKKAKRKLRVQREKMNRPSYIQDIEKLRENKKRFNESKYLIDLQMEDIEKLIDIMDTACVDLGRAIEDKAISQQRR